MQVKYDFASPVLNSGKHGHTRVKALKSHNLAETRARQGKGRRVF